MVPVKTPTVCIRYHCFPVMYVDCTETAIVRSGVQAGKLAVSKLLYAGLVTAVALPMALLGAASFIDTPWAVAMDRAKKVWASPCTFG